MLAISLPEAATAVSEQILDNNPLISDNTHHSEGRVPQGASAPCKPFTVNQSGVRFGSRISGFEKPIAELEKKIEELTLFTSNGNIDLEEEILKLHKKSDQLRAEIYSRLTPWQKR